jgi:hypothetical protein
MLAKDDPFASLLMGWDALAEPKVEYWRITVDQGGNGMLIEFASNRPALAEIADLVLAYCLIDGEGAWTSLDEKPRAIGFHGVDLVRTDRVAFEIANRLRMLWPAKERQKAAVTTSARVSKPRRPRSRAASSPVMTGRTEPRKPAAKKAVSDNCYICGRPRSKCSC